MYNVYKKSTNKVKNINNLMNGLIGVSKLY